MNDAVQAAINLLSRRDHCRRELGLKLSQRGFSANVVQQAIQYCIEQKWLNETEYARAFARSKAAKGFGPARINYELQQRDVCESHIQKALQEVDSDWFESAKYQRIKKFGEIWPSDIKLRQKQQRFLYLRGFSQEHIRYACGFEE